MLKLKDKFYFLKEKYCQLVNKSEKQQMVVDMLKDGRRGHWEMERGSYVNGHGLFQMIAF